MIFRHWLHGLFLLFLVGTVQAATPQIAGGATHTLVMRADSTVWGWGDNAQGALGNGTLVNSNQPVRAGSLTDIGGLAAGTGFSAALKRDGTVWSWGSNTSGQLGNGTTTQTNTPAQIAGLTGVTAIAAGAGHMLAVKSDGTVWAWGSNSHGQLGNGDTSVASSSKPLAVNGLTGIRYVAAGNTHSLAVGTDGRVWVWGDNADGALGTGDLVSTATPKALSLSGGSKPAGGNGFSAVLKTDGTVVVWGKNNATGQVVTTPTALAGISSARAVSTGANHMVIHTDGNRLWVWGDNSSGQLGDGTQTSRATPTALTASLGTLFAIGTGAAHSLAITTDGAVWTWGKNDLGQLGSGTTGGVVSTPAKAVAESGKTGSFALYNTTPASYSFGELANVELGKVIESRTVTINGINTAAPISIQGGEYSIAGGAYTSASGTIRNGQTVQVRVTAPSTFNASTTVVLTIGGASASYKVSTPTFSTIKSVTDILQNNDPVASVDSDGVLNINGTPKGPLTLKAGAPINAVIKLKAAAGVVPFFGHVKDLTYAALTSSTTLRVMPIPNTEERSLELVLGVVRVTATKTGLQVSLLSNDTSVTHLVTTAEGQSIVIARDPVTRNVAIRIDSGKVLVRRSAAGSTDFTTNTIYSGETLVFDENGQVSSVRLGSNGRDESLCGDPITLKVSSNITVPRLSCAPERLGGATLEGLVSTALGKLGLTVQSVSQDSSTGVVTLEVGGKKFRYLPVGDIKVDSTTAAGSNSFLADTTASSSSGTYQLAASGLTFSFTSSLSNYDDLLAAAQKKDATASMKLLDGGLIWLSWQGAVNVFQAGSEVTTASNANTTLEMASDGYYRFTDKSGAQQVMYPALASTSTVVTTFQESLADSTLAIVSNGNGTATATSKSGNFKLVPEYAVAAAASDRLDELWWADGSKIYVKYPDNTAQSFAVQ